MLGVCWYNGVMNFDKIKKNKNFWIVFLLILVILIYVLFAGGEKTTVLEGEPGNYKICFLNKGESGAKNGIYNFDYIEVNVSPGNPEVNGKIVRKKADGSAITGRFVGAFADNLLNIILTAKDDKGSWKEQKLYKIEDDKIVPADYIKKEEVAGVSIIPDIKKVTFKGKYAIKKVDCQTVDREEVGLK